MDNNDWPMRVARRAVEKYIEQYGFDFRPDLLKETLAGAILGAAEAGREVAVIHQGWRTDWDAAPIGRPAFVGTEYGQAGEECMVLAYRETQGGEWKIWNNGAPEAPVVAYFAPKRWHPIPEV